MDVNSVYRIMRFIARKNQLASLSPQDFQDSFNSAQRNYYDFLVGRIEQYRYDSPKSRIGLAMTDNVVSRLTPFQQTSTVSVTTGNATKPADFNKLLSMATPSGYGVYRYEENRLAQRLTDSIDPVNEENAFYVEDNGKWVVYPTTLATVTIKYLKLPTNVVWNYTTDGQGRPVYNPIGSVDPVWMDNDIDELIGRACKILGISIKENALVSYGQGVLQNGE